MKDQAKYFCSLQKHILLLFFSLVSATRICPVNIIRYNHTLTANPPSDQSAELFLGAIDLERARHSISSRTEINNFACQCNAIEGLKDLGEGYFPRYIPERRCVNMSCYYGHYSCKPVLMNIKVLTANLQNCRDSTLPPSIRRHWVYADVEVVSYCKCSGD